MRVTIAVVRIAVAVAIVAAVIGQLTTSLGYWHANGVQQVGISVVNFFSFFTIQSNLMSVLALGVGAALLLRGRIPEPRGWSTFRACVTTYMVITGIVYNLLLRGIELPQGATLEWANEVFHVAAPIWMLLDWFLAPGRNRVPWSRVAVVLAYPIVWIAYTLIRGPLTPNELTGDAYWYPYPFLNPNLSDAGYGSVAAYSAAIAAALAVVGLGVILLSRRVAVPGSSSSGARSA